MSIAVSENMHAVSQNVSLPSDRARQPSPDFLGIRKVASRKRKNQSGSAHNSTYDPSASPQSAFSSETESCADRLHFAHAAEQLVAAASLVASLSYAQGSPSNESVQENSIDTRSVSPVSPPSSPRDGSHRSQYTSHGSMKGLTEEERRQRRLIRNREAAKECRKKKKLYVSELEEKVQKLEDDNDRLHREVQELQAKLTLSTMHKASETARQAE
ncbi:hypothetical protein K493DRAFT_317606 [Basidiobolus meristosporus CBS 931.73]|uniref:BZIP domain-containing protein n=1 Tax=Basidiobolus meristosporus CBS 931.73 TaxID=1314790 RepID=A0A1Y1Y004_9FUNG|nr:hypothetical protein K493DRAFT_317606 [Basidiobolus meristosporus CBS 931.73]|eukprot:ORX90954.1 hypothetical protein K493DRAFT_317606 [Basidiobolus meristosporus CBS 931.73]